MKYAEYELETKRHSFPDTFDWTKRDTHPEHVNFKLTPVKIAGVVTATEVEIVNI